MAQSTPSSLNSSIDSGRVSEGSASGIGGAGSTKNVNFLSQLEGMMNAVKKEAGALDSMKQKLKDMDELKAKATDLRTKLTASDAENQQLRRMVKESDDQNIEIRNDMQRLNDIYHAERGKLAETQQVISRLEQELSASKLEKDFFTKEAAKVPELKSAVKTVKAQMVALKKSVDDEKQQAEQRVAELAKKCSSLEKLNEESGKHLFNVTEILNATQGAVKVAEEQLVALDKKLDAATAAKLHLGDKLAMANEDLRLQVQRMPAAVLQYEERIGSLKSELQQVKLVATSKTNDLFLLQSEAKKLRDKFELGNTTFSAQLNALQDNLRDVTNKNSELVKSNAALKQKLATKMSDSETLYKDLSDLKQQLKSQALAMQQKELENGQNIRSLTLQCEEVGFQLQTAQTQLEALQQSSKAENAKHWEEVKQLKDSEALLLEECDRLTQELQEKTVQLHATESEKQVKESTLRQEASGSSQMVATLKDELERRLKDLMQLREERDQYQAEKEELSTTVEGLKADMAKNENMFKKTLESDRAKLKGELQTRSNKVRSLGKENTHVLLVSCCGLLLLALVESQKSHFVETWINYVYVLICYIEKEKQELLSETQGLMTQVTESMREVVALQSQCDELKASKEALGEQADVLRSHNTQLGEDLKAADRLQEERREQQERLVAAHKQELERCEQLLRESKKSASQQVIEMSQHLKVRHTTTASIFLLSLNIVFQLQPSVNYELTGLFVYLSASVCICVFVFCVVSFGAVCRRCQRSTKVCRATRRSSWRTRSGPGARWTGLRTS
jgi:chromosome segregation ATPase